MINNERVNVEGLLPDKFDIEVLKDANHPLRETYLIFVHKYIKICFRAFYHKINMQLKLNTDFMQDMLGDVYVFYVANAYKYIYNNSKKKGFEEIYRGLLKKHIYEISWERSVQLLSTTTRKRKIKADDGIVYTTNIFSFENSFDSYNKVNETTGLEHIHLLPSDSFTPEQYAVCNSNQSLINSYNEEVDFSWDKYLKKSRLSEISTHSSIPIKVTLMGTYRDGKNELYFNSYREAANVLGYSIAQIKKLADTKKVIPKAPIGAMTRGNKYVTPKTLIQKVDKL